MALLIFTIFLFFTSTSSAAKFNILTYGAKPDGKTDSSKAFLTAWSTACSASKPATIYVPKGRFLLRGAKFAGDNCKNNAISFRVDGSLVAPSDYNAIGNADYWIFFNHVNGVSLTGGVFDAQGSSLWACKKSGKKCPSGATSIGFQNSRNIIVSGLTSINSQMFNIVINGCTNVKLQGVRVSSSGTSPNTDGIHVQSSTGVTILNTKISTGDDCVSIGPGTSNLWIEKVACGPGHGISIGSLGKEVNEIGVQNVTVRTVTFTGTQNGVRIKSWARPSSGFVRNIFFQHCVMNNVQNPIVIDQHYCPDEKDCPTQVSGVRISGVTYQDIHGSSATPIAVKFDCSSKFPCSGIRLQDVKLTYKNQPAAASCTHADGSASGFMQPTSCL